MMKSFGSSRDGEMDSDEEMSKKQSKRALDNSLYCRKIWTVVKLH